MPASDPDPTVFARRFRTALHVSWTSFSVALVIVLAAWSWSRTSGFAGVLVPLGAMIGAQLVVFLATGWALRPAHQVSTVAMRSGRRLLWLVIGFVALLAVPVLLAFATGDRGWREFLLAAPVVGGWTAFAVLTFVRILRLFAAYARLVTKRP